MGISQIVFKVQYVRIWLKTEGNNTLKKKQKKKPSSEHANQLALTRPSLGQLVVWTKRLTWSYELQSSPDC